jgi:tetratricopeptide (TPR) repeat protein
VTPQQRLLGQSALQAFRSDIIPGEPASTADDQSAVLVATLLRQSLAAADDAGAEPVQEKALEVARASLGEEALNEGCTYDDFPARSRSDVIRLLSHRTDRAGRLHLSQHMLESAAEIEKNPIDSARILNERARTARKIGLLDLSFEQSQQVLREGRRLRSPEIMVRGHLGLGALAQTRGNLVEYRERIQTSLRMARAHHFTRLSASAYSGLGTVCAMTRRYGDAVAHYWKAYELTGGKGFIAQTSLNNLGQTLLISGRPAEARKVATVVLQTAARGTLAPTLGIFAVASAQIGDHEGVQWAADQINQVAKGQGNTREIAEALMECSAALNAIAERPEAAAMKRRSEELAMRYGFHSLTFQEAVQSVQRISEPPPFNQAGTRATTAIEELEVPRIPELAAALPA